MTEDPSFLDWLGLSGLLSLLLGAFGYGRLHQRVSAAEEKVQKSADNAEALARLETAFDERTGAMMREIAEVKQLLKEKSQ
ncbi:MAG: hypothetical protein CMH91_15090 [Oceanicaulis sp.]|uniref:hypothetical protein n=1 Tax=Oceanicaulis sp. TaxID=1924941 RepID=UPI000C5A3CAF|nr:hypothetical protein [Oceanicaulis sp.]MBC40371.1 hypothetical protein [Oceanicaulis sp.]MBG37346.1 hypothetical protein [Oceanicaulis sp.]HBU62419.1 hypothetical protein [Oceanicaulis sp.]|tara:strand:+ start:1830 stop:2072 length:243 start_codon:yes stop_codon:yes gene_type:complete